MENAHLSPTSMLIDVFSGPQEMAGRKVRVDLAVYLLLLDLMLVMKRGSSPSLALGRLISSTSSSLLILA